MFGRQLVTVSLATSAQILVWRSRIKPIRDCARPRSCSCAVGLDAQEDDNIGYPRDPEDPRRRVSTSAGRNKDPILQVLTKYLECDSANRRRCSEPLEILEIASGTGQHVAHYAAALPQIRWQPSEWSGHASLQHAQQDIADICQSILAWTESLSNVYPPLALDASATKWPPGVETEDGEKPRFAGLLAANLVHIAPLTVVEGLVAGASRVLVPGGYLFLYGPFASCGEPLSDGNATFDASLRDVNPEWGLRDVTVVERLAAAHKIILVAIEDMPANNKVLVLQKLGGEEQTM